MVTVSTERGWPMARAARFEGRIGQTVAESEAWFDEPAHPGARYRTS